jgi:hypothetical protein
MLTSHQASGGCPSFAGVGGFFSELLDNDTPWVARMAWAA